MEATAGMESPSRRPEVANPASSPEPEQATETFVGRTRSRTRSRSKGKGNFAKGAKPLVLVDGNTRGDAVVLSVPAKSHSAVHHPNSRPVWQADADAHSCYTCEKPFTLRRRKHHCRACGKVVCGKCSPKEEMRPLPELGYTQ